MNGGSGAGLGVGLEHYLVLSAAIFAIGLYGALAKRNTIAVLMCIELMFNAANITLVAFSRFGVGFGADRESSQLTGQVFALFVIAIAAAEAAVALAILLAAYRARRGRGGGTVNLDDFNLMKW